MQWNLDITVYSTNKLGNRINRRAIPFQIMTAVTPVFFFFPGFHLCLPMGVSSLQAVRHPWKANLKKENQFLFFYSSNCRYFKKTNEVFFCSNMFWIFTGLLTIIWDHHHECLKHHIPPLGRRNDPTENFFPWGLPAAVGSSGRNFDFRVDFMCCNFSIFKDVGIALDSREDFDYLLMK
jgi:hypothetical protein